MIHEVVRVPKQPKTIREQIRADIDEAIDKHIEAFEFDGYDNYKALGQNVRTAIYSAIRRMTNRIIRERKLDSVEAIGAKRELVNPFTVTSRALDDRVHVFVEIDYDKLEKFGGRMKWR